MKKDITTEDKIKEVARRLFQERGYAATRTRDIANESGINIALLHYYFRSKENLFDIIMLEGVREVITLLSDIINDKNTTLKQKIEAVCDKYIDMLMSNPNLPLFVLNELRLNPDWFIRQIKVPEDMLAKSYFFKQLQKQIDKEKLYVTPLHIMINIVSMTLMPIVAKPFINHLYRMEEDLFLSFIDERRKFVPMWVKQMLKIED